jgi:hypothetical protein
MMVEDGCLLLQGQMQVATRGLAAGMVRRQTNNILKSRNFNVNFILVTVNDVFTATKHINRKVP